MNKSEIIKQIKDLSGFNSSDATMAINVVQEILTTSLSKGEKITIPNFGTFEVENTKIIFKPSKNLLKSINIL